MTVLQKKATWWIAAIALTGSIGLGAWFVFGQDEDDDDCSWGEWKLHNSHNGDFTSSDFDQEFSVFYWNSCTGEIFHIYREIEYVYADDNPDTGVIVKRIGL